jgi:hypothetical protein
MQNRVKPGASHRFPCSELILLKTFNNPLGTRTTFGRKVGVREGRPIEGGGGVSDLGNKDQYKDKAVQKRNF